ncbi:MAG: acyl-CoA synthetase, partial [Rhodobacteraceae bacterium]|nr:acyl-CoA synthetase [Paracoccaceae bacterium]
GVSAEGMEQVLIDRVKQKLSPHVAPRSVRFLSEMPMTATSKIMRRELRALEG